MSCRAPRYASACRRELNRASARRVRAKASATLGELASRMTQLESHNTALAAQVAAVEADRAALQKQARKSQWKSVCMQQNQRQFDSVLARDFYS